MMVTRHILVTGKVQGVWYRQSTAEKARYFAVRGWVKNLRDGRVEAMLSGDEAGVADLEQWMRSGPDSASVTGLESEAVPFRAFEDFTVVR